MEKTGTEAREAAEEHWGRSYGDGDGDGDAQTCKAFDVVAISF